MNQLTWGGKQWFPLLVFVYGSMHNLKGKEEIFRVTEARTRRDEQNFKVSKRKSNCEMQTMW